MGEPPAGASAFSAWRSARRRRRRAWLAALAAAALAAAFHLVVAAAVAAVTLLWLAATRGRDVDRWRRGAEGEQRTAVELARLPAGRWTVRHDLQVPGSRANLDHVVIGPSGVWLLDTKTTRLAATTRWRKVYLGGRPLDTASARWEAEVLADRLGVDVKPLVVLHGGGLRRRGGWSGGVQVVPVDRLLRRLRRGRRRLGRHEMARLSGRLSSQIAPAFGAGRG